MQKWRGIPQFKAQSESDIISVVNNSDDAVVNLTLTKRDIFRACVGCVGLVTLATLVQGSAPPFARAAGTNGEAADFTQLREDVKGLMKKEPNVGPTLVRLAWHSCGTYDKMTKTGGSGGGTIRFKEELAHGNNAGLDKMVALLEPVKSKHPTISYADMYAYAGKVAIEEKGGPTLQIK